MLAVMSATLVLALAGPGGCAAVLLVVAGGAIFLSETAKQRAREATVGSGAQVWVESETARWSIPVTTSADELAPPLTCTDEELCRAWQRTFAQLLQPNDFEVVALVAERRRGYLDELERRHPARFEAWIRSGFRAAADPTPFFL